MTALSSHPLFPDMKPTTEGLKHIHITRFEQTGHVWCPRVFAPDEIQELADVHALFGGGAYELVLRGETGRILDRVRHRLPGASIPLDGGPPPAAPAPVVATGTGGDHAVLLAAMQMFATMMQSMQQSSAQMVMAMLQASKSDNAAIIQSIAAMSQQTMQSQGKFFEAMASMKTESGGGADALMKGMELGLDIANGAKEQEGKGELAETIGAVVQGIAVANQAGVIGTPPAAGAPSGPAVNGGARAS